MGCTCDVPASCAASTALSRPAESRTAVDDIGSGGRVLLDPADRRSVGRVLSDPPDLRRVGRVFLDPPDLTLTVMYSVTKKIDFCYGHRLLDYDGICKHPHGHNAVAEIEVRTDSLGEPIFVVDSNPTVERIARLIYDVSREQGLPVVRVTVWETPTSWATYTGA